MNYNRNTGLIKCNKCGYVGQIEDYKVEPPLRKKDWIIGLVTIPLGGFGIVYLITTYFERSLKKRGLQCPICDSIIK